MASNYTIKLKFDTPEKTLDKKENGLRLSEIKDLIAVIDELGGDDYDTEFVLCDISDNCYQLGLLTKDEVNYNSLMTIAHNSANNKFSELSPIEKKFRKALNKTLKKDNRTLTLIDNKDKIAFTTKHISADEVFETYTSKKAITGLIAKIGDSNISKSSIQLEGYKHQIKVNSAQDLMLKQFYRTNKIRAIVMQKVNVNTGVVTGCELESFTVLKEGNLIDNLKGLSKEMLSNFKFDSNDDIIKALNG